jgi:1-acyl-sn-glycerol-3-phosphate acyltransferase
VFVLVTLRRSIRLAKGHIGMAEMALYLEATIVPIGCNGSDRLYPGASPFAKGGRVVYRMGKPIPYEELSRFHISEKFKPFDPVDEKRHREKFQGLVDCVMDRIDGLLDPEYQCVDSEDALRRETDRFL